MAKRTKVTKATVTATVAPKVENVQPVTQVASVATKLTKRNATNVNSVLVATDKAPKSRAQHNVNAWQAVSAALPATATVLAQLPALAHPACVSPQAYLSYMVRRGHLAPQSNNT